MAFIEIDGTQWVPLSCHEVHVIPWNPSISWLLLIFNFHGFSWNGMDSKNLHRLQNVFFYNALGAGQKIRMASIFRPGFFEKPPNTRIQSYIHNQSCVQGVLLIFVTTKEMRKCHIYIICLCDLSSI